MDGASSVLLFHIGHYQCAVETHYVERVIPAVLITQIPTSTPWVCGVVNVHGTISPVFDIRHHLNLPPREMELNDKMIIISSQSHKAVLWIEEIRTIEPLPALIPITGENKQSDLADIVRIRDKVTFLYRLDKLTGSLHIGDNIALSHR